MMHACLAHLVQGVPAGFLSQVKGILAHQPPFQSASAALPRVQYHIPHLPQHAGIPRKKTAWKVIGLLASCLLQMLTV